MQQDWLDELSEFLRIPSVSADSAHAEDVKRAGEWVCDRIRGAGGEAELIDWEGQPLAVGEIRASTNGSAPTVLCYGHFDVQPPAPLDLWHSGPFEPTVDGEYLVARGVVDDKGQLYMLLKAAELLASADELPVNLRFACDGEEETGGHSIVDFLAADDRDADACVIYDAGMLARGVPAFYIATRGMCYFHVRVRTGAADLHSGLMGGAAMNAMHALMQTLSGVLPRNGRVPEPLRAGVAEITDEEAADWATLTPGAEELSQLGAKPADPKAAEEFYVRTWGEPSVDVHGIAGGEPHLTKTVLPVFAEANVSIRLAPGQRVEAIGPVFERLLRAPRSRSRSAPRRIPDWSPRTRVRSRWVRKPSNARPAPSRYSSARVGRFRSCPRSSTRAFRRSSPASPFPARTRTLRTSGCCSSTCRWVSTPHRSCFDPGRL